MKITLREFTQSVCSARASLDESCPHLKAEQLIWESWAFDNNWARYIPVAKRNLPNGWVAINFASREKKH